MYIVFKSSPVDSEGDWIDSFTDQLVAGRGFHVRFALKFSWSVSDWKVLSKISAGHTANVGPCVIESRKFVSIEIDRYVWSFWFNN